MNHCRCYPLQDSIRKIFEKSMIDSWEQETIPILCTWLGDGEPHARPEVISTIVTRDFREKICKEMDDKSCHRAIKQEKDIRKGIENILDSVSIPWPCNQKCFK